MSTITHGGAMRYASELGFLINQLDSQLSDIPQSDEAVSTEVWTQSRAALMPRLHNLDAPLSGVVGADIINSIQTLRVSHRFFAADPWLELTLPTPVDESKSLVLYNSGIAVDFNSSDHTQAPVLISLLDSTRVSIGIPYILGSSNVRYEDTIYVVEFA